MSRSGTPWSSFLTSRLIRHRLPRHIALLLIVTVATVVGAAYFQLRTALVRAAGDRATTAATRLAVTLTESRRQLAQDLSRAAADTTIQRALTAGTSEPRRIAARALAGRVVRSVVGVRLLDETGNEVASAGRWPNGMQLPAFSSPTPDSVPGLVVGEFQLLGDTVYYASAFPVRANGVVRGSIVELRRVSEPGAATAFEGLIGSGAEFLVGNSNGEIWTNLERRIPGPSLSAGLRIAEFRDSAGVQRIGAAASIARTPWVAWVGIPTGVVLAPARRFLFIVGAIALVVVATGGLGGWWVSRNISGPLEEVSNAAEEIAAGNVARRVSWREDDEVGRMAVCFNTMAERVDDARRGLEQRVAERTAELETAVAELRTAQESLVRKERLATLGQLAGSVGHELRNPLGVMTNSLYLLSMLTPDDPPLLKEYLGIMKGQVAISEKIVGDLLDFARVKHPKKEVFPLDSVVTEQLDRVTNESGVRIQREADAGLPDAAADKGQVAQIVLNLLMNAVQAVGETPGTVTLRCQRDGHEAIRLDVVDTGCGIPAENLNVIFDPLFTTKARGIGLGLSVSRQLARANGGDITVTSEVGAGSTFSLRLPIAAGAS